MMKFSMLSLAAGSLLMAGTAFAQVPAVSVDTTVKTPVLSTDAEVKTPEVATPEVKVDATTATTATTTTENKIVKPIDLSKEYKLKSETKKTTTTTTTTH